MSDVTPTRPREFREDLAFGATTKQLSRNHGLLYGCVCLEGGEWKRFVCRRESERVHVRFHEMIVTATDTISHRTRAVNIAYATEFYSPIHTCIVIVIIIIGLTVGDDVGLVTNAISIRGEARRRRRRYRRTITSCYAPRTDN